MGASCACCSMAASSTARACSRPRRGPWRGQNHIGAVSVPALKSALPRSADFTFLADGRDKWGLGFLITVDQVPGKRSPGSLSWGGINNTFFWIDPTRGVGGVIMMQYLPFADARALAAYDAFERGAYQLVTAER